MEPGNSEVIKTFIIKSKMSFLVRNRRLVFYGQSIRIGIRAN